MTNPARRLAEDRATREAALAIFNTNLTQVRNDLEARGIGGRIVDKAGEEVRATLSEALAIADDNKGVVAATLAALTLWLLRNPLIEGLQSLLAETNGSGEGEPAEVQEAVVVSPTNPRRKRKEPVA